jgi:hypothetical protein
MVPARQPSVENFYTKTYDSPENGLIGYTETDGRTDVVFILAILFNISSRNVKPEVCQFLFVVHATCPY